MLSIAGQFDRKRLGLFKLIAPFIFFFCALALAQNATADKSSLVRAQTDIRAIQKALDLFYSDNSKYPTTEQGLEALVKKPPDPTISNYRAGGYLGALPNDPWGHPYQYQCPGTDGRNYDIISYGRDGKPGGVGFDADISN
jgi:general secretion pathway protein G